MGFFSKLFGGDEDKPEAAPEPAPVPAPAPAPSVEQTPGGPYRGAEFVVAKPELPKAPEEQPAAMWDSWSEVFALELGDVASLRSLVYCGETEDDRYLVRRVQFADGGVILDWELALPNRDALSDHLACRVDDRVLVPRATGLVAVHVVTGEPCWELPHPAALLERPKRYPDGDLLLTFKDQSWIRVAPRDGATRIKGTVRSDNDLRELTRTCSEIAPRVGEHTSYSMRGVDKTSGGLRVYDEERSPTMPDTRPGPAVGEYPIDEWSPKKWVAYVGDRLAVLLSRSWNDRTRVAVGILEPTSLEPLRLLELADVEWHCDCDARIVDDLLVIETDVLGEDRLDTHNAIFVVDAHTERVLAYFAEGRASALFDAKGQQTWSSDL